MNIKEFDKKYTSKGGIEKLANMRALLMPLKSIGSHFGVSRERVRQIISKFHNIASECCDKEELIA